ncbi:MAG TPA: NusG domain II-containing protein [Candidatus Methanoperedens sp.]|nr:NusG domain II-containing protein [Candidatus Methanoperedens sp.]
MSRSLVARVWGEGGVRLLLGDAAVLALLGVAVAVAVLPRGLQGAPTAAEVRAAGGRAMALALSRDGVTEVPGPLGITKLEVRAGRVRVLASPCPRQACRHGGWVGEAGQMLVCLPNEVVVRLPGGRRGAPDAVAR